MSAFTQDNDFIYIDRSQLPETSFPSLSEPVQLMEQVLVAFKPEIILNNQVAISEATPQGDYFRSINNQLVDKKTLVLTAITDLSQLTLDPDEVING